MSTPAGGTVGQRRWYYPALATPGIVWLLLLFIMPFYAIAAVAFGTRDQIFALPIPAWNPLEWQFETFSETAGELFASGGSRRSSRAPCTTSARPSYSACWSAIRSPTTSPDTADG